MTAVKNHHRAMELTDKADALKRAGETEKSIAVYKKAFEREREAALSYKDKYDAEPTRSVLFRSAASLAIESAAPQLALEMIMEGLYGNPPPEIREELLDLLNIIEVISGSGGRKRVMNSRLSFEDNAVLCRIRPIGVRKLQTVRIAQRKNRGPKKVLTN